MGRRKKTSTGNVVIAIVALIIISLITKSEQLGNILFLILNIILLVLAFRFIASLFKRKKTSIPSNTSEKKEPQIRNTEQYPDSLQKPEEEPPQSQLDKEWSLDLINSLEWKRFEELCAGYFTEKGYRAEVSRQGADGGIDIYLYKDSYSKTKAFGIVQCKAWNTYKVGVKPVRELFGVMAAERAPLGVFINSGAYTREAEEFAKGKKLKLLTGQSLLELIKALPDEKQQGLLTKITSGDFVTPSCPSCGTKMIKRTSKKSKNLGSKFWGCVNYPKCKNTLQVKKAV